MEAATTRLISPRRPSPSEPKWVALFLILKQRYLTSDSLQYYFVAQVFYCAATIPIKCSICVALIRIAGSRLVYRYILYGIIGLTIASGLATAIGIMNVCRPIAALWGGAKGTCDPSINSKVAYFFSAMCILTDWTLATLPAWILWNVQLKQRIRISVAFLLALGAL